MRRAEPRKIPLAMLALACGLARCADTTATQLLVVVSMEPAEGLPVEVVDVEVQSEDTLTTFDRARFPIVGASGGRYNLPLTFGVAPRGVSAQRVRVTARARLRDGAAARALEASALTTFVAGQKLLLPLVLDYRCSLQPPCAPGFSCSAQQCVSEVRPAASLRVIRPDAPPPATGSVCARPAEACIDRCDEGTRAPVTRFVNGAGRSSLTTTPDTPPCCGAPTVAAREVFAVAPAPRPDLLPLYICRASDEAILYSLRADCEGYAFNDGVLGYVVAPATPERCGTVPLYRLHNPRNADRFYTTRADERDRRVSAGYVIEQVAAWVWPGAPDPCGPNGERCADAIGCADGTREAFTDRTAFPHIAACAGAWSIPGIFPAVPPSTTAACATLGNSSTTAPADGAGCASSNLCAAGWHVCFGGEIRPRTADAGCLATAFPPDTFFAAAVSGPGCFRCALRTGTVTGARCAREACMNNCSESSCSLQCRESPDLTNDLFGCGSLGYGAPTECDGLDRTAGNNCEAVPRTTWRCEGLFTESRVVTKVGPANGGVLCCRDGV
jgi:hypothetical protein